jgi:enolase-phosphatase E1
MSDEMPLRAVVLDIAGTTSATAFFVRRLNPYSAERFAEWAGEHTGDPDVAGAVAQVRELIGDPAADSGAVAAALSGWLAAGQRTAPLNTIQGKIWAHGFTSGDLVSHFYPDVIPALRRWHAAGLRLQVFSAEPVAAQRGWFGHSPEGNLLPLISGFSGTGDAGPVQDAGSYRRIAAGIRAAAGARDGPGPAQAVLLSSVTAGLDAAREAGWQTVAVRRPREPQYREPAAGHLVVASFDQLDLSGGRPAVSGTRRRRSPAAGAAAPPAQRPPGRRRSSR